MVIEVRRFLVKSNAAHPVLYIRKKKSISSKKEERKTAWVLFIGHYKSIRGLIHDNVRQESIEQENRITNDINNNDNGPDILASNYKWRQNESVHMKMCMNYVKLFEEMQ